MKPLDAMSNIVIRRAKNSDLLSLRRLIKYLMGVEKVEDVNGQTKLILKYRIKPALFPNSSKAVFVAQYKKRIVGFVLVEVLHKIVAHLPYLVVDPNYQKQGIGKRLIEEVIKYGHAKKIKILQTVIHKDNKKSKKFHQKIGFHLFGFVFRKNIKS